MSRSSALRGGLAAVALCAALLPAGVRAQGIALNRYTPAETVRDGFYLSRPDDRGHLRYGFDLHLDYANDPLVLELRLGDADSESRRVIADHFVAHAGAWFSLGNRLVIFGGIDVNLVMSGDSFRDPETGDSVSLADDTSLGDARLGARLRLFGENDDVFAVAAQVAVTAPLADAVESDQNFAGEDSFTVVPELLLEVRPGGVKITGNVGIGVRQNQTFVGVELEEELRFGLGATIPLSRDELDLLVEVFGTTELNDPGDRESTPLEALIGAKYWLSSVCAFGAAGGPGLQRGIGAPDFRAVGSFGCDLPPKKEYVPPPPPSDSDGDGLIDRVDACPKEPEDKDQFEDSDGCPDPDNDKDTVLDVDDQCPLEPEDKDGFQDEDGCPDPDNDADGLLDPDDRCPLEAEDQDQFQDEDGCPDPDNDKDGVLDVEDKCPLVPGTREEQGCSRVRVEEGRITILDRVEFATNKDVILPRSEPIMNEVRATLEANPQLKRIRIEGHTDSRGRDAANMELSRRRAASVARWLIAHGIDIARLEAYGCGESISIDTNDTEAGRQANRRVEFHIIDPAPKDGVRAPDSCRVITP